jgi:hypothetical protein
MILINNISNLACKKARIKSKIDYLGIILCVGKLLRTIHLEEKNQSERA